MATRTESTGYWWALFFLATRLPILARGYNQRKASIHEKIRVNICQRQRITVLFKKILFCYINLHTKKKGWYVTGAKKQWNAIVAQWIFIHKIPPILVECLEGDDMSTSACEIYLVIVVFVKRISPCSPWQWQTCQLSREFPFLKILSCRLPCIYCIPCY
jgi:hypothetical protein